MQQLPLGWKDTHGSSEFANRQRACGQAWRADTIYTPGFVINGQEWRNWGGDIRRLSAPAGKAGVLELSSTNTNRWRIQFYPETMSSAAYQIHLALLGGGLWSNVNSAKKVTG